MNMDDLYGNYCSNLIKLTIERYEGYFKEENFICLCDLKIDNKILSGCGVCTHPIGYRFWLSLRPMMNNNQYYDDINAWAFPYFMLRMGADPVDYIANMYPLEYYRKLFENAPAYFQNHQKIINLLNMSEEAYKNIKRKR